jgi:hypothetical protein
VPPGLTKPLRRFAIAVIACAALVAAILLCFPLVPAAWCSGPSSMFFSGFAHYTNPIKREWTDINPLWRLDTIGHGVIRSYRLQLDLKEHTITRDLDFWPTTTREQAIDTLKADATSALTNAAPEAVSLVDQAAAHPGTPAVYTFQGRTVADRYMMIYQGTSDQLPSIVLALLICSIVVAVRWRANYRTLNRARRVCPGCSYNLSGLGPTPICPECGRYTVLPPETP